MEAVHSRDRPAAPTLCRVHAHPAKPSRHCFAAPHTWDVPELPSSPDMVQVNGPKRFMWVFLFLRHSLVLCLFMS